jgi:hypothetical protein
MFQGVEGSLAETAALTSTPSQQAHSHTDTSIDIEIPQRTSYDETGTSFEFSWQDLNTTTAFGLAPILDEEVADSHHPVAEGKKPISSSPEQASNSPDSGYDSTWSNSLVQNMPFDMTFFGTGDYVGAGGFGGFDLDSEVWE